MNYPTHRGVVVARNGILAASQPLAVSAGLRILQLGGTFVDAAIATSAVLSVTEPYSSQLGGDAFVIAYSSKTRRTTAYNGSGAAPASASLDRFRDGIPVRGLQSASVPGLIATWFELYERHGALPMPEILRDAIGYARNGFPAGFRYCRVFEEMAQIESPDWFRPMMRALTGLDRLPQPGDIIRQPDLAETLDRIAQDGRNGFYDGPVAERIAESMRRAGGLMTRNDLARHATAVKEPIRSDYKGYTVHAQPPVSQGHILLQMLNTVEEMDIPSDSLNPDTIHAMVEAKKLAFADRAAYLGDPDFVEVPVTRLLSKEYAAQRRTLIDPNRAAEHVQAGEVSHDTTYFCVADHLGNAVSFIQSVFYRFGCGVVAEGTGILFNNRMTGFSLDPASPNVLSPGKRTAHTLNAYIVTKGDKLVWIGGTPGADVQVQSNLQVIRHVIDSGANPQQAIELPRWQHSWSADGPAGGLLEVEDRFPEDTVTDLRQRGHNVEVIGSWAHGSVYQLVHVNPETGSYMAGSDPRADGHAAGF